jgi:hypothetical protein
MKQTIVMNDINSIANKLDKFGGLLDADEYRLLLAIFRLAGQEVERRVSPVARPRSQGAESESGRIEPREASSHLNLSTAFADTFKPLKDRELRMREQVGRSESGARIVIEW